MRLEPGGAPCGVRLGLRGAADPFGLGLRRLPYRRGLGSRSRLAAERDPVDAAASAGRSPAAAGDRTLVEASAGRPAAPLRRQ